MKVSESQINYIFQQHPEAIGDNTKFLIAFYETVCLSRDIPTTWENIKVIMNEFKPELITRKRRQYTESTKEQMNKEQEYHEKYLINNPSIG